MKDAHPYEEVAYDVYPVQQVHTRFGLGAVGELEDAEPLEAFLDRVTARLGAGSLRYVGDPAREIKRVAVCGGSGSSLLPAAIANAADAFVTADVTYHKFFDALDVNGSPRIAYIDAGHYETEAMGEDLLLARLQELFDEIDWMKTGHRTSPIRTFAPSRENIATFNNE